MRALKLVILLLVIGCESRFEFETDKESQRNIVISGFINQSAGPYYVYISQTQSSGAPRPIVGASIALKDQENNSSLFRETDPGVYINDSEEIIGQPGLAYHVEVTLLSGEKYRSMADTIPKISASHRMTWNEYLKAFSSDFGLDFDLPVVSINLDVTLPETNKPHYFNWIGEETFQFVPTDFPDPFGSIPPPCYVTQLLGTEQINLFSNLNFTGNRLNIEEIFWREIDDSFVRKHIFSIYQHAISEQYYTYLKGVESLVENTGSLFDTPPGQVVGNFTAMEGTDIDPEGYFSAYLSDTARIAIYPSQIETFIYEECLYRGGFNRDYDPLCVKCLLVPRSSYDQPDYWLRY
ncbi:MAG: hypothetical protein ACI9A7_000943 [Cyclobacteriaceae bacterium]|jgi:hypothetical protein